MNESDRKQLLCGCYYRCGMGGVLQLVIGSYDDVTSCQYCNAIPSSINGSIDSIVPLIGYLVITVIRLYTETQSVLL